MGIVPISAASTSLSRWGYGGARPQQPVVQEDPQQSGRKDGSASSTSAADSTRKTGQAQSGSANSKTGKSVVSASGAVDPAQLNEEDLAMLSELQARDTQVRQHEAAHLAAAGGLALSGASFSFQRGPDGAYYAIGGEVSIDVSPGQTPEETIDRARRIRTAALAPADPSSTDVAVAAQAQQMESQAVAEQASNQAKADRVSATKRAVDRAYGVDGNAENGSRSGNADEGTSKSSVASQRWVA